MSKKRMIIYVDTKSNNNIYNIKYINIKTLGAEISLLDESHSSFNEKEKTQIREILLKLSKEYRFNEEDIPYYLNLTFGQSPQMVLEINEIIKQHNAANIKTSETYDYFKCSYRPTRKTYLFEPLYESSRIEKAITNNSLIQIHASDVLTFSKEAVIGVINEYRLKKADFYIVYLCPVCQTYTIYACPNHGRIGYCEKCHNRIDFNNLQDTLMETSQYNAAVKWIKDHPIKEAQLEKETHIFRYRGTPYGLKDYADLFAIVLRNQDVDAVFIEENGLISFKEDFFSYLEAINASLARHIDNGLSNVQATNTEGMIFDKTVALYWFYHHYTYAIEAIDKSTFRNAISTNVGVFNNRLDFINRFLKEEKETQKYMLSLLNPTYIEYFFSAEDETYFDEDDIYYCFSKLIFKLTNKYVYIDPINYAVTILEKSFLKDVLKNDSLTYSRYLIVDKLLKNDFPFFLGENYNFSLRYNKKRLDGYDLLCYFAWLYRQGDYCYLDLKIPCDSQKCKDYLRNIVSDAYLNNDYHALDLLNEIYKNEYLASSSLESITSVLDLFLKNYRSHDDILDIYLNIQKSYGLGINDVDIIYQGQKSRIGKIAVINSKNNRLDQFVKDKAINHILDVLIDNKVELDLMINKQFNELDQSIEKMLEGY